MNHELFLEVSDSNNPKVMRLFDTSHYCEGPVENYLIEVLPVNKDNWVTFHVKKNFSLTLNSSNLGYKKVNDKSGLVDLPDGIYEIKQSIKPNIRTVVHYYHLRVTDIRSKLRAYWDRLISDKCNISKEEYRKNRDKLREIDEYIMAAKYKVEDCGDKAKGKELYDWALKLLEDYSNECQC